MTTAPSRPPPRPDRPPPPRILAIPVDLTERPQWIVWRYTLRDGRWTKVPYRARPPRREAKSNDPATWDTLDVAWSAYEAGGFDGVGYVFADDDPYFGTDLDNCLRDGSEIVDWAVPLIAKLEGTYGEISPSGNGIKFIAKGKLPGKGTRRTGMGPDGSGALELYDSLRYFALTGNIWSPDDSGIADRQAAADALYTIARERPAKAPRRPAKAKATPPRDSGGNGTHDDREVLQAASGLEGFDALYRGNTAGYGSVSEADAGLMNHLAYVCGPGQDAQVIRLYRGSTLGRRDKADRDDYVSATAAFAYSNRTAYFDWTTRPTRAAVDGPSSPGEEGKASAEPSANGDHRPVVFITTEEADVNDRAIDALKADRSLYRRNFNLVAVARDSRPDLACAVRRAEGTPFIRPIQAARLRELLTRNIRWKKFIKDKHGKLRDVKAHPPAWSVGAILAREEWPDIRYLIGVIEVPTLRGDGGVIEIIGYDRDTGLLYAPSGSFPRIPPAPSREDARKAAALLLGLVGDFPFKDGHEAAWLAALLTPLIRHLIDGPVPLFLFEANTSGAGKTLLCDLIAMITTGRVMTRTGYYHDAIEMDKQIVATALAGDRVVLFDNVDNGGQLGNSSLDRALTGRTYRGRILGRSEMTPDLDLISVFYCTGNNLALCGDIPRRIIPGRLESPLEHPEEREDFAIRSCDCGCQGDILAHAGNRRGDLVAAALTIVRAFIQAGLPDQKLKPMDFAAWCRFVRNAVYWATGKDPAVGRNDLDDSDPDRQKCIAFIDGWYEVQTARGVKGMTSAELLKSLTIVTPAESEAIRSAMCELWPKIKADELPSSGSIGMKVQALRDKPLGNKCFKAIGKEKNAQLWAAILLSTPGESSESNESSTHHNARIYPVVQESDTDAPYESSGGKSLASDGEETHQTHQTHPDDPDRSCGIDFRTDDPDAF
jgi:primase-polymerase (primpol)-like protein